MLQPTAGTRGRSQQPPALVPSRNLILQVGMAAPSKGPVPLSVTGLPPSLGNSVVSGEAMGWGLQSLPAHTWRGLTCRWIKSAGLMQKS